MPVDPATLLAGATTAVQLFQSFSQTPAAQAALTADTEDEQKQQLANAFSQSMGGDPPVDAGEILLGIATGGLSSIATDDEGRTDTIMEWMQQKIDNYSGPGEGIADRIAETMGGLTGEMTDRERALVAAAASAQQMVPEEIMPYLTLPPSGSHAGNPDTPPTNFPEFKARGKNFEEAAQAVAFLLYDRKFTPRDALSALFGTVRFNGTGFSYQRDLTGVWRHFLTLIWEMDEIMLATMYEYDLVEVPKTSSGQADAFARRK